MKKTNVGMVQINNSFSGQSYFPYSVGLLQAYAEKYLPDPSLFEFVLPVFSRVKVSEALDALRDCDIVVFSTYVWNINISLAIAEALKKENTDTYIVFGGPQVPDIAEDFLSKNSFIDLVTHGPGEVLICDLLTALREKKLPRLAGVSFFVDGSFFSLPQRKRVKADFEKIVSPYLAGVFEPVMKANPETKWLALWETNRGCPFSCTFCDWGSATASKVFQFELEVLKKEIDWFSRNKIEFIFCCDANFGILQRDVDIAKYVIDTKKKTGYPHALSVQNTKNAKERAYQVQKMLAEAGLNKGVTLSMQSVDKTTLENVKRDNISLNTYRDLQQRFNRDRVETYNDLIIALPGESYKSYVQGIETIIQNGQHNRIQFNNLSVLPNAAMGDKNYQLEHGMEIVTTDIINVHGSLVQQDEVIEQQELVVATKSMPADDWLRARTISWMVAFLYFDKLIQIPIVVLDKTYRLGLKNIFEAFCSVDKLSYPVLSYVYDSFYEKARDIQFGGKEYCRSEKWLNIWWPADELMLIELSTTLKLDSFYKEAKLLLVDMLLNIGVAVEQQLMDDLFKLNRALLKQPHRDEDTSIHCKYNVLDVYNAVLVGKPLDLRAGDSHYVIHSSREHWDSWDLWCREVVWYGNKKGAYLYQISQVDMLGSDSSNRVSYSPSIAGHF